jgi:hypothetical protein
MHTIGRTRHKVFGGMIEEDRFGFDDRHLRAARWIRFAFPHCRLLGVCDGCFHSWPVQRPGALRWMGVLNG